MSPQNKVPVIRFEGFNGKWEEKALAQYAKFRRGSFPQPYGNKEWYDGQGAMPFVQVVDVTKKLALVKDTKQKISAIAQPKSVFVEKGKVLVTLQGSIGRVAIAQYNTYVDRTLLIFETFEKKTDSHYWAYLIQNKFDIEKRKAPGGTIKTITKEALSVFLVHIPEYKEQTKIGNYFQQIDTLIAQHEQKHDKLLNLKKSLLEKMFPKQGVTEPAIRFKGFTGQWEEKVLGEDVSDIIGGGTPSTQISAYWDGDIHWYSPTEIGRKVYAEKSMKKITQLGLNKSSARILPADKTVLFTSRAGIGDMAILSNEACTNQGFQSFVLKKDYEAYFIYSMGFQIKDYALKHASGSTFLEISGKQLGKMIIKIPLNEEQTKIGKLFKTLDTLISQQQAQLKKLRNIKQACLDKMFV